MLKATTKSRNNHEQSIHILSSTGFAFQLRACANQQKEKRQEGATQLGQCTFNQHKQTNIMLKVINVIIFISGNLDRIKSFIVSDESKQLEVVAEAERFFKTTIEANGYDADDELDIENFVEDGYYCNGNFSAYLSWSV